MTENATVAEVVDLIRNQIGDLSIEYVDSRIMNQLSYTVDCAKIKSLGFQFRGSLAGGINETIRLIRGIRQVEQLQYRPHG